MADAISDLILLLNKDDIKDFKAFLKRKNKRNDVKNIKLLEIIETDDINKLKKLYDPIKNRDAYHALRKRLHDSLLFFLSNKVFERDNSEAHEALRLFVVGRFLLESQFIKIGFKCLQRAEEKALVLEQFSLLNEILQIRLQYAHLDLSVNLELLIDRFTENQQKLQREAKFQIAYALLRSELQAIHLKAKIVDLNKLILSTLSKYRISLDDLLSFKSLYQLLHIANEYAAIHQNYALVRSFLKTADNFLMKYEEQSAHHLFYYLHILYYLANFNLRNGLFNESIAYLERLDSVLSQGNAVFRAQFQLRYHLLMALNFHYLGDGIRGLSILRAGIKQAAAKSNEVDLADLQLCLVMFLTQFEDKTALVELRKLIRRDSWYEKKMGMLWTIRKSLLEILIHIQFDHIDLAALKLKSFMSRYKKYLLRVKENRVIDFVKLVEKYLLNPSAIQVKSFREAVEALVKNEENKDLFVMGFLAWLKALVMSQNPYQVLLGLIKEDIYDN
ncbi:hypothetical protein AAW12_20970 [Sphingobacterium sp. Ag1]|uniref:hypothetical protein n=1 Tax=Sphingobacterium sp. Ag1 TaxID=1643451 RepID=UPI00062770AE|nr:hypothetical protein [Sphingobacterium sp. Ag1]KKO88695.1 hypothetical protein AAW12_20970 [Sphingobacterium sp. Ag1]